MEKIIKKKPYLRRHAKEISVPMKNCILCVVRWHYLFGYQERYLVQLATFRGLKLTDYSIYNYITKYLPFIKANIENYNVPFDGKYVMELNRNKEKNEWVWLVYDSRHYLIDFLIGKYSEDKARDIIEKMIFKRQFSNQYLDNSPYLLKKNQSSTN